MKLFLLQVKLEKHASQKDYSTGFGGKYGVQEGSKDKVRIVLVCFLLVVDLEKGPFYVVKTVIFMPLFSRH